MARKRRNFPHRRSKKRGPKKTFTAICASCGKELKMEVPPPPGQTLLCLDCYHKGNNS